MVCGLVFLGQEGGGEEVDWERGGMVGVNQIMSFVTEVKNKVWMQNMFSF